MFDNLVGGHREAVLGCRLIEGDIRDGNAVRRALRETGATAVMHFAALLSVADSVRDPIGYYHNNVYGALTVLEAMIRESTRYFVFSSTAATFGEPTETPISEDHPQRPVNSYGETKLAIERALPHFDRAYGLKSVCLRYFNAAGADPDGELGEQHDPEVHLIPLAIEAALGGRELQVFGDDYPTPDGTCLRDYVHVTDLAQAHVLALRALERGARSTVYNLGNGRPISVRAVIDAVAQVAGRPVPHRIAPRRPGDPAVLYASSARIKQELGWTPRFEELERIVATAWRWRQRRPEGFGTPVPSETTPLT